MTNLVIAETAFLEENSALAQSTRFLPFQAADRCITFMSVCAHVIFTEKRPRGCKQSSSDILQQERITL
jgi:hypothetical protein